ncbi:helix-turn-helix domain-containing protein [Clostridium tetani]|uniref:XRE family transcriptional regulator n=1 Tax=Clostridium tetani TaxID=1513 RepID=A0ABY0EPW2_CLOTA|nr:helix-turn-helix transcriptional regulator [Clostridium tetani]RXI52638.1 XRE family transcriptional regulator [Clostridium tetani]RXI65372.1 XRE family transcriptional regulator [Clostridium tetani]
MFNKNKLVKALENKKWSAYKLWKVSGVSQSVISDIINGKVKNPTVKTLSKIADALGVSVNEFFDGEDTTSEEDDINVDEILIELSKTIKITPEIKKIVISLSKLTPEDLDLIENLINSLSSK